MNDMKRFLYVIVMCVLFHSCETDTVMTESDTLVKLPKYPETEIAISNHNYANSMALPGLYDDSRG